MQSKDNAEESGPKKERQPADRIEQDGESDDSLRARALTVPTLVTPAAILAAANAILGAYTAIQAQYPMLRGTIRDHVTRQRRPFVRFFACEEDWSHESPDAPLPEAVASGVEPLLLVGAIAGG